MNDVDGRLKRRKNKALKCELEKTLQEQDRRKTQDDAAAGAAGPSGAANAPWRRVSFRNHTDIIHLPGSPLVHDDDDDDGDSAPTPPLEHRPYAPLVEGTAETPAAQQQTGDTRRR
ncbi:hypothetical protein QIS74_13701 [Colletotrichum tabaci]|uniref:BZIP domain-containing protein n=1 Tax=Colletotrichum tabaci TaxID=1209068 RepID=A0AAV9SSX8_9PEZI